VGRDSKAVAMINLRLPTGHGLPHHLNHASVFLWEFILLSFLFLNTSRFSLCSPSFYVPVTTLARPQALGKWHFMCVSMRGE
jgi:hypothetical protein